uniref:Uncharacterized protein n=1 Tax=Anguilla anguilla TaxID=7936 RepID=A0A0E9RCD7_ANGAN
MYRGENGREWETGNEQFGLFAQQKESHNGGPMTFPCIKRSVLDSPLLWGVLSVPCLSHSLSISPSLSLPLSFSHSVALSVSLSHSLVRDKKHSCPLLLIPIDPATVCSFIQLKPLHHLLHRFLLHGITSLCCL